LRLKHNDEIWTLTKRNKSKIQAMDMKSLRSDEGKIRNDGIRNYIYYVKKKFGVQNMLT
jgi:hypothetical protein